MLSVEIHYCGTSDSLQAHDLPTKGHKLMIQKLINDSLVSSWWWMENEEAGWPLLITWISVLWTLATCCILLRAKWCNREGAGKHPSLFSSASHTEKQFITLSDSLSKTDMIKNNIKWIMFSSDWYHYNCQPDFCRQRVAHKQEHTHTLWGWDRHTDAVISCLCAWVICPRSLLQMARRLKRCGGTNDVGHVFRGEKQQ